jgi:hypothetical protein
MARPNDRWTAEKWLIANHSALLKQHSSCKAASGKQLPYSSAQPGFRGNIHQEI